MQPSVQTKHPTLPTRSFFHLLRQKRKAQPRMSRTMMTDHHCGLFEAMAVTDSYDWWRIVHAHAQVPRGQLHLDGLIEVRFCGDRCECRIRFLCYRLPVPLPAFIGQYAPLGIKEADAYERGGGMDDDGSAPSESVSFSSSSSSFEKGATVGTCGSLLSIAERYRSLIVIVNG